MTFVTRVSTEFLVNTQTASEQLTPTVTGLANGGFIVSWQDFSGTLGDPSGTSIKAQVFNASGAKVGSEFLVNTQTSSSQERPAITALASGGFVVSWQDYSGTLGDPSGYSIKAQVFNASGAKVGSEYLVNTQTSSDQYAPSITGLVNGGFVVSWQDYDPGGTLGDGSGYSIKAQVFTGSGAKLGGEFLVNTQTADSQYEPAVTALSNGGFVVSWYDSSGTLGDSSGYSIKAQVFNASGAKVGSEFLVNTQTNGYQYYPAIGGLRDGGFVVSWQCDGSIRAQIFNPLGAKVEGELFVSANGSNPTITSLANGNFVVSWQGYGGALGDGDGSSIQAQEFDASGVKVGSNFLVNTETSSNQYNPTITGLASGGFVVSWQDYSGTLGDPSGYSIKAQVFTFGSNVDPVITSSALINVENGSISATKVVATDANVTQSLAFAIVGGADALAFNVDPSSGQLSFKSQPYYWFPGDEDRDNAYEVVVEVTDGNGGSDAQNLFITVGLPGWANPVILNGANNSFVGTLSNDWVEGRGGNDRLYGMSGGDTLDGGTGSDRMFGGNGDDTYVVDSAADSVVEKINEGVDTVYTALAAYTLGAHTENLIFASIGLAGIRGTGNALDNRIEGTLGSDTLDGRAGNDTLIGGEGNDILIGGNGFDYLNGGGGNDTYVLDLDNDPITGAADGFSEAENEGVDLLLTSGSVRDAAEFGALENITLTGAAQIDALGNSLDNVITGNSAANIIDGADGNDRLIGGAGDDVLVGGEGDDILCPGIGNDLLSGGNGIDTVSFAGTSARITFSLALAEIDQKTGGSGVDTLAYDHGIENLIGGKGADILSGDDHDNQLNGGLGKDTLFGWLGRDSFVFDTALGAGNIDLLRSYNADDDTILLAKSIFTAFTVDGALDESAFNVGSAASQADDRIIYNPFTGSLIYDPDGSGYAKAVQFASLSGLQGALTASNFAII